MYPSSTEQKAPNLKYGLANFKAFGTQLQEFDIKPITLIFGPNSVGKSSLIHSLFWAKDVLEGGNPNIRKIESTRKQVDLGGFSQTQFKGNNSNDIALKVQFGNDSDIILHFGTESALPNLWRKAVSSASEASVRAKKEYSSDIEAAANLALHFNAVRALSQFSLHKETVCYTSYKKRGYRYLMRLVRKVCPKLTQIWRQHPKLATELGTVKLKEEEYDAKIKSLDPLLMVPAVKRCNATLDDLEGEIAALYFMYSRLLIVEAGAVQSAIPPRLSGVEILRSGNILIAARLMKDNHFWLTSLDPSLLSADSGFKKAPKLACKFLRLEMSGNRPTGIHFDEEAYQIFERAFTNHLKFTSNYQAMSHNDRSRMSLLFKDVSIREFPPMEYIGPLRHIPDRQGGLYCSRASDVMPGYHGPWGQLLSDERLRQEMNWWMSEKKLQLKYEVIVDYQVEMGAVQHILESQLAREFKRIQEEAELPEARVLTSVVEFNLDPIARNRHGKRESNIRHEYRCDTPREFDSREDFLETLDEPGTISRTIERLRASVTSPDNAMLRLKDSKSGTRVALQDIGVGISQVMPLILQCVASKGALIAIEQPEIHVHPALQAELGDLFIESALKKGNTLVLETHSEHLILRIMRRIRETCEGTLPEGKPAITSSDVCILYVEPGENGSIIREMPLNERGELVKGWPGGFFEEALNEMF